MVPGAKHCGHCGKALEWQPVQRQGRDLIVWRGGTLPPTVKWAWSRTRSRKRKSLALAAAHLTISRR